MPSIRSFGALATMESESLGMVVDTSGLRERNVPHRTPTAEIAKKTAQELNAEEYASEKAFHDKRTFGRTPDGVGKSTHTSQSYVLAQNLMKGLR